MKHPAGSDSRSSLHNRGLFTGINGPAFRPKRVVGWPNRLTPTRPAATDRHHNDGLGDRRDSFQTPRPETRSQGERVSRIYLVQSFGCVQKATITKLVVSCFAGTAWDLAPIISRSNDALPLRLIAHALGAIVALASNRLSAVRALLDGGGVGDARLFRHLAAIRQVELFERPWKCLRKPSKLGVAGSSPAGRAIHVQNWAPCFEHLLPSQLRPSPKLSETRGCGPDPLRRSPHR